MPSKTTQNYWKQKAIARRKEIARLKKRMGELRASRAHWKAKYQAQQKGQRTLAQEKAQGHHYPVALVWLCLYIYHHCHCSLRSCSQMVASSALLLQIECRRPQAASIRHWVIKYGYYCYQQDHQYTGTWAIIVDESISIGQEKLLLVLGLPVDEWAFEQPLSHQDVRVLHLSMATSWKANAIEQVLRQVATDIQIGYCVSDQANNIKAAIRALRWPHFYDCSHQWAHLMKQLYEKDPGFLQLFKQLARLRRAWALSGHSYLIPPSMRSKARFLNLFPLIEWIERIRGHWGKLPTQVRRRLSFLHTHQGLIDELSILKKVIQKMGSLLKIQGMNPTTLQACSAILAACQEGRPLLFKTKLLTDWQRYLPWLGEKSLLCCSDIIESYFGRFKQRISPRGCQTLSESVLMIAAWSQPLTKERVKTALGQVSMTDIEQWKKENLVPSLLKKRKAFFAKKCPKIPPDF